MDLPGYVLGPSSRRVFAPGLRLLQAALSGGSWTAGLMAGFAVDALDQSSATLLSVRRVGTLARRFNRGGYPSNASAYHWRLQHSTQCRDPRVVGHADLDARPQAEVSLPSPLPPGGGRGWKCGLSGAHLFLYRLWVQPIACATIVGRRPSIYSFEQGWQVRR